jgi:hypothetical protein
VRVDVPVGFVFLRQIVQQFQFNQMLQHIGMVAGVKSVAVTQHLDFLSLRARIDPLLIICANKFAPTGCSGILS